MSIVQRTNDDVEIDFWEVVKLLYSKALPILLCTLVCGLAVYAGTYFFVTPKYEASITLYVNNNTNSASDTTAISQGDLTASAKLVDTYSAIIVSKTVLQEVIDEAEVDLTVKELKQIITTASVNDTEVFQVKALFEDPKAAARIVNTIAEVAPIQISQIVKGSSVEVVDYADIPDEIASPGYMKMTVIGMVVGFLLSIAIILLQALTDTRVKSEVDFNQWSYPLLSIIPDLEEAQKSTKKGYGYGYGGYGRKV